MTAAKLNTQGLMCPIWCTTDHVSYVADGGDPLEHHGPGCDLMLDTHRNYVDGRVTRDGGGEVRTHVEQRSMERGGWEGPAVVELVVRDIDFQRAAVRLTSGEARSLARQLERLADIIDLRQ